MTLDKVEGVTKQSLMDVGVDIKRRLGSAPLRRIMLEALFYDLDTRHISHVAYSGGQKCIKWGGVVLDQGPMQGYIDYRDTICSDQPSGLAFRSEKG